MSAAMCTRCTAETFAWLDTITPGPHQPYPWEPHPLGHLRVADADNPHARISVGTQRLRVVRGQLDLIRRGCERDHRGGEALGAAS